MIKKLTQMDIDILNTINLPQPQIDDMCHSYLNRLNYHIYGLIRDDTVTAIVGFYQSVDDASWYLTFVYSIDENDLLDVLDEVCLYNEQNGLLKFYASDMSTEFNSIQNELTRYQSVIEFEVEPKHHCVFTFPWQILFRRVLSINTVQVKCFFLKNQHRTKVFQAGRL